MPKFHIQSSWPLQPAEMQKIHKSALDILDNVGMADAPKELCDLAVSKGCRLNENGRLCFPPGLVEDLIAGTVPRRYLPARDDEKTVQLDDGTAHFGHFGIAPMVVDFETGSYRDATLVDLYDFNRLIDALPNIDTGGAMIIPGDVTDTVEHMLNKLYGVLSATTKHVILDFNKPVQIEPGLALLKMLLDGIPDSPEQSTVTFGFCPTRSPLRYEREMLEMSLEVARRGYPVSSIMAPLAGATAPATLAGALSMTLAESLGALAAVQLVIPGHPQLLGIWPFVSDLRTGSFSGGGPEVALLNCAAAQLIEWYGIEGAVAAGMSDAKAIDAQSGYEKGITVSLAAVFGNSFIGEAAGMQGSLMGASHIAYVIDDEMLAGINRIKRGIEVTDETLSYEVIAEVVEGSGDFLSHPQTLHKMRSEYTYPTLANRQMLNLWNDAGCPDIIQPARARTRKLLSSHYPVYIDPDLDGRIRARFPIHLRTSVMRAECGRW